MELKTLKDIPLDATDLNRRELTDQLRVANFDLKVLYKNRLRKEAIKWIQELDEPLKRFREDPEENQRIKLLELEDPESINWIRDSYTQIRFIKHFFNISEEDLK